MKSLQIVGRKKSGKTGLVVRLLPLLRELGLRISTVKHSNHPYPLDRPGSDSMRHRQAGSEATMLITAAAVALHFPLPEGPDRMQALIERLPGSPDLVLIEGWAQRRGPKIEVLPADGRGEPRNPVHSDGGELLAVVLSPGLHPSQESLSRLGLLQVGPVGSEPGEETPADTQSGIPCYRWEDVQAVADLVMRWWKSPTSILPCDR